MIRWHFSERPDMYLTRMELNPARRGYRALTGSPQRMHAAVEASVPRTVAVGSRKLWRLDADSAGALLFVKTDVPPDLTHLAEQAGWPTKVTWVTKDYLTLFNHLAEGQVWAFRVRANPTHSGRGSKENTQRFAHVTTRQQAEWLSSRAPGWGFRVLPTSAGEPDLILRARATTNFLRDGNRVTLTTALFEGRLMVTDRTLLRGALALGMGPAKAYGCGLMTLSR